MWGKWLRTALGVAAGIANLIANGMNWKQALLSTALAGFGIISHLTGLQDTQISPVTGAAKVPTGGATGVAR